MKTIAVGTETTTLLVDGDGNGPGRAVVLHDGADRCRRVVQRLGSGADSNIPLSYMQAFDNIVWYTGNV